MRYPARFVSEGKERNSLLHLACFWAPLLAVIMLHSVLYDDWRHLYFIYPAFVLMAVYAIYKLLRYVYNPAVQAILLLQVALTGCLMIRDHPFEQVYFNRLVAHDNEYLHQHYEMEYWGAGFKQALDHLVQKHPGSVIKVSAPDFLMYGPLQNNLQMMPENDRKRIQITAPESSDYYITNFRNHPLDTPYAYRHVEYAVKRHNSTIICVYKTN